MRLAVTGGSGFIGSHVVQALLDAGHVVVNVDQRPAPIPSPGLETAQIDICDTEKLTRALDGCPFVFHLAGVSNVNEARDDPRGCVRSNVLGTTSVLEAARRCGARRVVLASTVWVYSGVADGAAADETAQFDPAALGHVYVSSKLSAEMLCFNYRDLYDLPFTILRYGIPYGPGMRTELMLAKFIAQVMDGETLRIAGDGSQFRKFLYIEDLAAAHLAVLSDAAENQVYNVVGSIPVTVREAADTVSRLLGEPLRALHTPSRPGDYKGREVTSGRIARELGWQPRVSFDDGVRRTIDWFHKLRRAPEPVVGDVAP
jgi:UDP-glucose 4-epimerase